MHTLDSFVTIVKINGATLKASFDEISGLTIAGTSAVQAQVMLRILENITPAMVRDLVAASVADPAPPSAPVPAPTRGHQGAPGAVFSSEASPAPQEAEKSPQEAPVTAPEPEEPAQNRADDTTAPLAQPGIVADDEPEEDETIVLFDSQNVPDVSYSENDEAEPAPKPEPKPESSRKKKKRGPRKKTDDPLMAPPRVDGSVPKLNVGNEFQGSTIVERKDHSDGGCLYVLATGTRVKVDAKGDVVASVEGPPPALTDEETNGEVVESEKSDSDIVVPSKILESRRTRDIVQFLLDNGIVETDDIVSQCVVWKEKGAKAFLHSKDESAVKRRVISTLTVMGRV